MPEGVEVVVEEGFATIDFVDTALRGPGLARLLEVGTPPDAIEKLTRTGPRAVYVVPEGNAREAGLLDEALPTGDFAPKTWPDGEPELEWKRPELDAYAASKGLDTLELPNKDEVLKAIAKHVAEAKNS
ncbi:hypothetical protein [Mycobacteroides abscessus]|uniref:hypothetical protein n=1 Tax=Mycobacteroides abscessus TaxID=36809 RepID=UPI002107978E|nr:hypothetical protein [Mycobacteroides abscessus]